MSELNNSSTTTTTTITTRSSTSVARPEYSLRKVLRRWRERLKGEPHSTDSPMRPTTPSATHPTTTTEPPILVPPILFTPTTQTIISSPADPRNSPPTTLKRLRMARRNTAPADYFAIASMPARRPGGSTNSTGRPVEGNMPNNNNANGTGTGTGTGSVAESFVSPLNTVTTMITATHPQTLRTRKSRLRLSFSMRGPVVEGSNTHLRTNSRATSQTRTINPTHTRESSPMPTEKMVASKDPGPTVNVAEIEPSQVPSRTGKQIHRDNNEEGPRRKEEERGEEEELPETGKAVRRDTIQEDAATKLGKSKDTKEEQKRIDRQRRETELLLRAGEVRLGMMV